MSCRYWKDNGSDNELYRYYCNNIHNYAVSSLVDEECQLECKFYEENQPEILTELCPFCGSNFIQVYKSKDNGWYAECISCDSRTGYKSTRKKAVESWNKRIGEES